MGSDNFPITPLKGEEQRRVRRKEINRQQLLLRPVEVEKLVDPGHPVRAIWELVGRLNLEPFYAEIESVEGVAGRPVWDPRLLISLWLYAYKDGVSSAREIARLCEYHPAYQWLSGLEVVNYHTLADFRIRHKEALDQLFIEVLGVLSHEGLITLQRVMHDGTKVKACASDKSFHRKARLQDHLRLACEQVEQMGDPESEELSQRVMKARQRALREKQQRLEEALKALEQIEASRSKASEKEKARASSTDPEARVMLQAKGAYGPSYNVQISTDAQAIYKQRAGVAEFPNAWIKDKIGLRQFRLRGLVKVTLETLWACLTYNICQWIRLCWKPQRLAQA
jgi:transposase